MKENLIDKLPSSYSDFGYKKYFEIMTTLPSEKPAYMEDDEEWTRYISFHFLSIMLDIPMIDLERLPAIQLTPMIDKINFLSKEPRASKNRVKIKSMHNLTYNDFVNFQRLRGDMFNNIDEILSVLVIDKTKEEIQKMSVTEVYEVFFCLISYIQKFTKRLQISLLWLQVKQAIKMKVQNVKKKLTHPFKKK